MSITVLPLKALQDNYIWIVHNEHQAFVVDPGESQAVLSYLNHHHLELVGILITHHHHDHVGGVQALKSRFSVNVYGPSLEAVDYVDTPLRQDDVIDVLGMSCRVYDIPGHTLGHIAYFLEGLHQDPYLFCGDTLFSVGCGRIFEGTPEQMLASLDKLADLPGNTKVCCGHEYTLSNIAWAKQVEPNNRALLLWEEQALALREKGEPTLPTTIALERLINPFLRVREPSVQKAIQLYEQAAQQDNVDVVALFSTLRTWKNKG